MGKETIIAQIRKNKPEVKQLPDIQKNNFQSSSYLYEVFKESLKKVGTKVIEVTDELELEQHINTDSPNIIDFTKLDSWERYPENCSKEKLETIETAILMGQFGVAENGAIWLSESNFPNRLIPFIAEKLIICLDSNQIVYDMHQAYSRLGNITTSFGVFISGPSKTADIEQTLVYGAHGAISLTVLLLYQDR
jgi:L-lactate dehydrogenase complex protein LldG